jgi:hypothetical protein
MEEQRSVRCVKCGKLTLCKAFHEDPQSGERLGPFCPRCRPRSAENYVLHLYDPTQICETHCEGCVFTNPQRKDQVR